MTLTRQQFEAMIQDYVESTIAKVRQALDEARVEIGQLSRVLLVGGSTRIPLVQQRVAAAVGVAPEAYVDVDLSVALGAAAQSALDQGLSCAQIVVDISPHALGIAVLGDEDMRQMEARAKAAFEEEEEDADDGEGWMADGPPLTFAPVIRKNARLPAKFIEEFYTLRDGQDGLDIRVYQGESRNNLENVFVGSFFVPFAPKPAGSPVHIGFEYDQSGLVRVSVAEQGSTKVLKSYTMDLKRSADSNTEARAGRGGWLPDDDLDVEEDDLDDAADRDESSVSNYLIEQIERRLAAGASDSYPEIRSALVSYRQLLAAGDDAAIDSVEERLYAWIEEDRGAIPSDSGAG